MQPSIVLKSFIAAILSRTGLAQRALARMAMGKTGILMYHRILSAQERHVGVEPGMYVDDRVFSRQVAFLKQHCHIVPLDRILDAGEAEKAANSKPECALTFDDGWADFLTHAFPILEAQQVPATVFLPTDFIGTEKWFWTDRLAIMLLRRPPAIGLQNLPSQPQHDLTKRILGYTGSPVSRLDKAIAALKPIPPEQIEEILQDLADFLHVEPSPPGRAFLSWEEIRTMAASGLVTFGSHTAGHAILTTITPHAVEQELLASKNRLQDEKVVKGDRIPFCYPNGNYNQQIAALVRQAGYSLAVTTEPGWNPVHRDAFTLKRIPIHHDMTATRDMFLCRLAGIF